MLSSYFSLFSKERRVLQYLLTNYLLAKMDYARGARFVKNYMLEIGTVT